jgi:hypothetical protein
MKPGTIVRIKPEWQDRGDERVFITRESVLPAKPLPDGTVLKAKVAISAMPVTAVREVVEQWTPEQRLASLPLLTAWNYADLDMLEGVN